MSSHDKSSEIGFETPIWNGRPAVGSIVIIFGVISLAAILILTGVEYVFSRTVGTFRILFPASVEIGGTRIPYPVEIATVGIIAILLVIKLLQLAILSATNKYELKSDGLYLSHGIISLENSFLAPMAFSDARLIRTVMLRIAKRGLIIVDANDGRHFYLRYIKDSLYVQTLIRRTLSHPTVHID